MMKSSNAILETPVVLIIFKRPQTTQAVLNAIREVRPTKVFVVADGPRPDKDGEAQKCAETRAVIEQIDWDCDIYKQYSEVNLGCGIRPATGIDWVFSHDGVDDAIILEDDCLPHPTFFHFCETLLDKYRDEPRVMSICGSRFAPSSTPYSYYFSHYVSCWGWATWRRGWQHFDFSMNRLPKLLESDWLYQYLGNRQVADFWAQRFQKAYDPAQNDIWDYQWQLACWIQKTLTIRPSVNLISNIGIGADSTHTSSSSGVISQSLEPMTFPLKHPDNIIQDVLSDDVVEKKFFVKKSLRTRTFQKFKNLFG